MTFVISEHACSDGVGLNCYCVFSRFMSILVTKYCHPARSDNILASVLRVKIPANGTSYYARRLPISRPS